MLELVPYLKQKGISFEQGLMLVDIKLCQSITEIPEAEALAVYIDTFKRLNLMLQNVIDLTEEEKRLFNNANLDLLQQKPEYLFSPEGKGFLYKRLGMHDHHHPELIETLKFIDEKQPALKAA